MATFYTDSGSFAKVDISGSGQEIFTISGSAGPLLEVSDITAGANVFQISSASIDLFKIDQSKNVRVSGSLQVTGSIFLNGSAIGAGGGGGLVVAAGGSTETVSTLVFSNAGGISWGINGGTITAAEGAYRSYYENIPIQNTALMTLGGASMYLQPFMLPYDVSISYIRMAFLNQFGQSTFATTNNTTIQFRQSQTYWYNIYSLGNGASSRSLQYYTQASISFAYGVTGQQGTAIANQTMSTAFTYPGAAGVTGVFNTSTNPGATNLSFATTNMAIYTGVKFLDIPFNASLASGQWYMGLQKSTVLSTTGLVNMSNLTHNNSVLVASQIAATINNMGLTNSTAASYYSTNGAQPGLGFWQGTANGATTDSLAFSQITVAASNVRAPFQFIRQE